MKFHDIFGKLRNRAPERDQVYKTNRWSRYQWDRFLEGNQRTEYLIEQGTKKFFSFPQFSHETFHKLYDVSTKRLDKIRPEDQWAVRFHDEMEQMPEWARLNNRCQGDRLQAGTATHAFINNVQSNLTPPSDMKDPEPLREEFQGLMNFVKQLKEAGQDITQAEQKLQDLRAQGKEAVDKAVGFANSLDSSDVRNIIREGISAAQAAVDEQVQAIDSFCGWGSGTGIPETTSPELKAEIAATIRESTKLQELAKVAGRMRRLAIQKQRTKAQHCRSEISDIECGNDLERLLPSEVMKMNDPVMSFDFFRKYLERGLQQYKLQGTERAGQGPIVVCIDHSSSMHGQPEIWSKGVALALIQIAALQHRWVQVINYSHTVKNIDNWDPKTIDPSELLQSMKIFHGGGTNFEYPLEQALQTISTSAYLQKADIIFITDGKADVSDQFLQRWKSQKEVHSFMCYGVHIGAGRSGLERFSDKVVQLAELNDTTSATDVLFDI